MFYEVGGDSEQDTRLGFHYSPLFPAERSLPVLPRYLFGDISSELLRFYLSQHGIWQVGIWTVEDITVAGPGLLSRQDVLFCIRETNTFEAAYKRHALLHKISLPIETPSASSVVDGVLLIGPGYPVYGHWLVDILPKLYLLHINNICFKNAKFLLPTDCPRVGLELLNLLGVPSENIIFYDARQGCSFRRIIVPTLLRTNSRASRCFANAVTFLLEHLRRSVDCEAIGGKRWVFVSRGKWTGQGRRLLNRQEVESTARDLGYTIYTPEVHPITDQVATFLCAEACAGEYGSAMHNSIFCPVGTPVCLLRWPLIDPAFLQSGVGAALNQPTGYVIGKMAEDGLGYHVCISDVRNALQLNRDKNLLT